VGSFTEHIDAALGRVWNTILSKKYKNAIVTNLRKVFSSSFKLGSKNRLLFPQLGKQKSSHSLAIVGRLNQCDVALWSNYY